MRSWVVLALVGNVVDHVLRRSRQDESREPAQEDQQEPDAQGADERHAADVRNNVARGAIDGRVVLRLEVQHVGLIPLPGENQPARVVAILDGNLLHGGEEYDIRGSVAAIRGPFPGPQPENVPPRATLPP